jgi:integrase
MPSSRRKLSDSYIAGLKPASAGKRRDIYDNQVPGLLVRVTDAGTKSLMLYARWPGRKHFERRLIGKHGAITIEQARRTARDWQETLRNGNDPRAVADAQRQAALRAQQHTFAAVVDDYVAYIYDEGQRKAKVVERELRSVFVAAWGERPIASITLHDVRAVIVPVKKRGAKYHAHTLFGHIRTLFRWTIGTGSYGLEHSPCDHLQPRQLIGKKAPRQRVLSDDELRAFWAATARLGDARIDGYPWCPLLRLLLLTGQRKTEISDAQWDEFDLEARLLTIPEARFKSDAVHLVPLSADAMAIVTALPRFKYPKGEFVFSTTLGAKPVDGFSKLKAQLDALMLEELRRLRGDKAKLEPWVLHDLRRTVRTRLAWLGTPEIVAERVIGHSPRDPLQKVYNRFEYLDERREALENWATALGAIVTPAPPGATNVMRLRA